MYLVISLKRKIVPFLSLHQQIDCKPLDTRYICKLQYWQCCQLMKKLFWKNYVKLIFQPPRFYVKWMLTDISSFTMLQKLSKCEVKAWFCSHLIIYRHSDFTWNQILAKSISPKMSFLAILQVLNFDFSKFEQLSSPKFNTIQISKTQKLQK